MREIRLRRQELQKGTTRGRVASARHQGAWTLIVRGALGRGPDAPTEMDRMRATALVTDGVADAVMSGQLHGFDGLERYCPHVLTAAKSSGKRNGVRRVRRLPERTEIIGQVKCMPANDTLHALCFVLEVEHLEWAVEYCLRHDLVTRAELEVWAKHSPRLRKVIELRGGLAVAATESLLETRAVQLIRQDPSLPPPTRQYVVYDRHGVFVARVDLCWPELGVFLELDGQGHAHQPVYDANRQTRVAAVTRWLCGRKTWDEIVYHPTATLRELRQLLRGIAA